MRSQERVVSIVRWVAVLPGALVGAGLLQFLLVVLHTGNTDSFAGHLLLRTIANVVFGAATVGLASSIAPSHKEATAIGVAALFTALSAVVWITRLDIGAEWDRYATVVSVVAAIITAFTAQRANDPASHTAARAADTDRSAIVR